MARLTSNPVYSEHLSIPNKTCGPRGVRFYKFYCIVLRQVLLEFHSDTDFTNGY